MIMKTSPLHIIFMVALGLTSCSSLQNRDDRIHKDYLIYRLYNDGQQGPLILYDPASNVHTQILPDWEIDRYSLSTNNRLAFSTSTDEVESIFVLDYPFTENVPIEIIVEKSTQTIPMSWSPYGRLLLFYSIQENGKTLSLWNGKNTLNIYDYRGTISEVTWGPDGQLAFTEFYDLDLNTTHEWGSSEVFIWDGNAIRSASQNPSGEDRFSAWSQEGQLAFLSSRDGTYAIFVWDGVSKDNGVPDIDTFTKVDTDLHHFSNATWTSSNTLAFNKQEAQDLYVPIYEWDGQSIVDISNNPSSSNGFQTWRDDGYWAFSTFFSEEQNVYVRDETNQTVLTAEGQWPVWSRNGLLMFCVHHSPDWTLSIWNGGEVIEVVNADFIHAKWNNGEEVFCSNV